MNAFENTTVIVTGGTRGIGRAISKAFLERGAQVVATYRGNDGAAESFKGELEAFGQKLMLKKFDLSSGDEVKDFYKWFKEQYPSLEVLVNNAGLRKDQLLPSLGEKEWDEVLNVNLKGSYLMSKQATLLMLPKRYGRIINISSIGGNLALPGQSNYAASKAGQVAMSLSLSKEIARKGITVNNVLPGFIETELIADLPLEQRNDYKKQVPMRRFGKTEEVAYAVLFLASKEASYITGANLAITGGL